MEQNRLEINFFSAAFCLATGTAGATDTAPDVSGSVSVFRWSSCQCGLKTPTLFLDLSTFKQNKLPGGPW